MKISYNTVIDVETIQRLERYIEKAAAEADQAEKRFIDKAHLTEKALNEFLDRAEKDL